MNDVDVNVFPPSQIGAEYELNYIIFFSANVAKETRAANEMVLRLSQCNSQQHLSEANSIRIKATLLRQGRRCAQWDFIFLVRNYLY